MNKVEQGEITDEDIERESENVIMNHLTHNDPDGDYKESTIDADDKRIWFCKGAKAMRDGKIKRHIIGRRIAIQT